MMSKDIMQRQMFAKGGAAFPDMSGDGRVTQKDILMGRGVIPMQEGGDPMAMAAMMPPQDPAAMMDPMAGGQTMDPEVVQSLLQQAQSNLGNIDEAEDYATVINSIRGDDAPIEARYAELAELVGPEDAQQTPESVLALVQPAIIMNAVDQGIGGLAAEEMTAPVEGAMAEGIMSTVAPPPQPEMMAAPPAAPGPMMMGGPPPVNFNQGGLVRRGDNQPVVMMQTGGDPIAAAGRLGELYEQKMPLYQSILGDQSAALEEQKNLTQAQMLFDVAGAALAYANPTQAEIQAGRKLSPAERLAAAMTETKLLPTISARAGEQLKAKQAVNAAEQQMKLSALGAAEAGLTAEAKAAADLAKTKLEGDQKLAGMNLQSRLDTARQERIEELKQSGASKLEAEKQGNREAQEALVQENRVIIENLRQAGDKTSRVLANELEQKNILLRGDVELAKLGVMQEFEIKKIDTLYGQQTALQNSRLAVQQNIADNADALKRNRLELDTLNSALDQARKDKNFALAEQTEARLKKLGEDKLALDEREVDLKAAAQNLNMFGTGLEGKITTILAGPGATELADKYASGNIEEEQENMLNMIIPKYTREQSVWDPEAVDPNGGKGAYVKIQGGQLSDRWLKAIEARKERGASYPTISQQVSSAKTSEEKKEAVFDIPLDLPKLDATGQPVDIRDTTYESLIAAIDPAQATGAPTAFKNALNRTAETILPVFGQPFPASSKAALLLENLNTTTLAAILAAQPGKENKEFQAKIEAMFPTAGAWTEGDQTALNKVEGVIAYLNRDIGSLSRELSSGSVSPPRAAKIKRDIFTLSATADAYSLLAKGYQTESGSGDPDVDMQGLFDF
jgi:hypothetical protein